MPPQYFNILLALVAHRSASEANFIFHFVSLIAITLPIPIPLLRATLHFLTARTVHQTFTFSFKLKTHLYMLSPFITPSAFHSRFKTHLFRHKSFHPESFWFNLDCHHLSFTWTERSGHWHVFVVVSSFIFCL